MTPRNILVVEDDDALRERLLRAFHKRGFETRGAADGASAIAAATQDSPEFAVVDQRLPDQSGLEVIRALHQLDPATRMVMLTGYGNINSALEAVRLGAVHYLTKPANAEEILAALHRDSNEPFTRGDEEVPSLEQAEWDHIHRVLGDCDGNISQAARLLGLHRRSLQRKLQRKVSSP